jgi:hypothetical protein
MVWAAFDCTMVVYWSRKTDFPSLIQHPKPQRRSVRIQGIAM